MSTGSHSLDIHTDLNPDLYAAWDPRSRQIKNDDLVVILLGTYILT